MTVFSDGATLLEVLGHHPLPDVLVMDWEMPGLTGIDVCRFLRGNPATRSLPILLLTSHQLPEDVAEGLAAGANDYVFKPFRAVELEARVLALVRLNQLRQQTEHVHARTRKNLTDEQARRQLAEQTLAEVQAAEARAWRSEQRFRLATLATRDAIWEWQPEADLLEWSGVHPLLGTQPPGGVERATWWEERIHPEDRERAARGFRAALEGTGDHWLEAYRFLDAEGRWADVVDRAHILRDEQGRGVLVVGSLQDVTVQRRLEVEARQHAEFERQLIGIVSHDLRSPLSASSLAALTLSRRGALDESQTRCVRRIIVSTERATRLIQDLLDFTQARHGSMPVYRRASDLHEVVRAVTEEVQSTHPDRRIELEQSGSGAGEWDPDRLGQVVTNLVSNALAYSPSDTPVRVRTRGEERAVVLEFHNAGTPIPPRSLARIFEPMERGTSEQAKAGGTSIGLGLFIVRSIVRAHGGTIDVRSTATEGTTFTVKLPR